MNPQNTDRKQHSNLIKKLSLLFSNKKKLPFVLFIVGFGIVGVVMLFQTFALGSGNISGTAFKDLNRNGAKDVGEETMVNQQIALFSPSGVNVAVKYTDAAGNYSFSGLEDGTYRVAYASPSWATLKQDWTPTTTTSYLPEQDVNVASDTVTANFGFRQITRSIDPEKPITEKVYQDGLRIQIYNDVINPDIIYNTVHKGSLIGAEKKSITIKLDLGTHTAAGGSYAGSPSSGYCCAATAITIDWSTWLTVGENALFHEYGHAWSNYFSVNIQQDPFLSGYLKARGLFGDPRLDSSYGWGRYELIAEDYRQLFASAEASAGGQANGELPPAKDVPGLKEYLSGPFVNGVAPPPTGGLTAPSNLSGQGKLSTEGPGVQLNWTASAGSVARYDIYRNGTKVGVANAPSTTFYDGLNLQYGSQYTYYVKAIDTAGNVSPSSNTITVTTPASDTQKPSEPGNLTSTGITTSSISLQWSAATDNVGIKEYRVYLDGTRKTIASLKGSTTQTTFAVTGLKANTGYSFYVTAVDLAGNESLPSKLLSVKTKR